MPSSFKTFVRQQLARFWPPRVIGNDQVGWSARFSWDRNWCWASSRDTAVFGCRQRGRGL